MQKIKDIAAQLPEILMIKKSCNLIGQENFGLQLVNQSFPRHKDYTGKQKFRSRLLPAESNKIS